MHLANLPDSLALSSMRSSRRWVRWVMHDAAKYLYPLLELRFTIVCPTFSHHLDTIALVSQVLSVLLARVRKMSMSANHND